MLSKQEKKAVDIGIIGDDLKDLSILIQLVTGHRISAGFPEKGRKPPTVSKILEKGEKKWKLTQVERSKRKS